MNKFKAFAGPVVFLMGLDICHASVAQEIEGAKASLYALSLLSYHGKYFTQYITEAQLLVEIMQSGYALRVSTGSIFASQQFYLYIQ